MSCDAHERMIWNASCNLSEVLIINRNNLEMSREGSGGKGHSLSLLFVSLAVGQPDSLSSRVCITLSTKSWTIDLTLIVFLSFFNTHTHTHWIGQAEHNHYFFCTSAPFLSEQAVSFCLAACIARLSDATI